MIRNTTTILLLLSVVLLIGTTTNEELAFAISAGEEYEPTQPNALVSYNNATNQINVSWDFDNIPNDRKCFLKSDLYYHQDLNIHEFADYVRSFTPNFYSATSNTPVLYENVHGNPDDRAEFQLLWVFSLLFETQLM